MNGCWWHKVQQFLHSKYMSIVLMAGTFCAANTRVYEECATWWIEEFVYTYTSNGPRAHWLYWNANKLRKLPRLGAAISGYRPWLPRFQGRELYSHLLAIALTADNTCSSTKSAAVTLWGVVAHHGFSFGTRCALCITSKAQEKIFIRKFCHLVCRTVPILCKLCHHAIF